MTGIRNRKARPDQSARRHIRMTAEDKVYNVVFTLLFALVALICVSCCRLKYPKVERKKFSLKESLYDPAAPFMLNMMFLMIPYGAVIAYSSILAQEKGLTPADILPLMQDTFRFVAQYEGEVPGAAPEDCGNYLLHDLPMARWEAAKYLHEVLERMTPANMEYPAKDED